MSERVLESVSIRINNLIGKCMSCEMNIKEVQTEIINIMNAIIDEYNEIIKNEFMNEIHISLSKILFWKNFSTQMIRFSIESPLSKIIGL